MQVTREDLNPCTVKLDIVCDPDEVQQGVDKAFKQLSKNIKVPGFRPGHAPKNLVEPLLPVERLYDAAVENIVRSVLKHAIEEQGLVPYRSPAVEITKFDHLEGVCEFNARVPLKPVVELGDYKGLSIERPEIEVTDEEVEQQIENMRREKSTREAISDRGIQEGDVAVVNIKLDGQEGEGRNFMTIAGQTFDQLDKALVGMKAESIKSAELTFPENFQEKDWAGKKFNCTITVRSVSSMKLPELDDSFASSFNLGTVDELKIRVREGLGRFKAERVQEYVNEQLHEELLQRSTVHVPDTMWQGVVEQRLQDIQEEQAKEEKTVEQYAQDNGMTLQEFVERLESEAATHVKRAVMVQELAEKEQLKLTNQDLNDELVLMSREYEVEPEAMLGMLKKNQALGELQHRALFRKVTQYLSDHAETREVAMA